MSRFRNFCHSRPSEFAYKIAELEGNWTVYILEFGKPEKIHSIDMFNILIYYLKRLFFKRKTMVGTVPMKFVELCFYE